MRISSTILAVLLATGPDIAIIDSKVHPGKSWVLVDDCAVEVKTSEIKDNPDKVVKQVNDFCGLSLDHVNQKE